MPTSPAIATTDLTRRFGDVRAVDGADLTVPRRAVYGFLGPNGAGKSTTIRMLLGLLRPTRGTVRLLGRPLPDHRESLLREVGALVEAPSVYDHLTGRENLRVTAHLRGELTSAALTEALDTVGLRDAADQRVGDYSMGMRQRLGLALALLGDPSLLILDEPTNGLDPAGMQEVRTLLRRLPERAGVTVFLSSHLLQEVERVATHVGIIRDGTLLFQGRVDALEARRQAHVVVETDRPAAARDVLAGVPADGAEMTLDRDEEGRLRVRPGTEAVAAECTRRFVAAGLEVYRVSVEEASLEDVFLDLTDPTD